MYTMDFVGDKDVSRVCVSLLVNKWTTIWGMVGRRPTKDMGIGESICTFTSVLLRT